MDVYRAIFSLFYPPKICHHKYQIAVLMIRDDHDLAPFIFSEPICLHFNSALLKKNATMLI